MQRIMRAVRSHYSKLKGDTEIVSMLPEKGAT